MTEPSNPKPPQGNEQPEVYSIEQNKDRSFHLSRKDFLHISAITGGAILIKGICPRFGAIAAPGQPLEAGVAPAGVAYLHAAPSIDSNIVAALKPNDIVRLVSEHPHQDWLEVATRNGEQGWLKRNSVDFAHAVRSSSPNFDLGNTPPPDPVPASIPTTFFVQLHANGDEVTTENAGGRQALACGEAIQNGNFEAGRVSWVETSTGVIIRNDYPLPYQGSWVAWLGGDIAAVEKLTQSFDLPADIQDAQTLGFYLKVSTEESGTLAYDFLRARLLNASGNPISSDIALANNTTSTDWLYCTIDFTGLNQFAGQSIQIQFEAKTDASSLTSFVIDLVSLVLACGATPPTPTQTMTPSSTPTVTPTPTATMTQAPVYYTYLPIVIKIPTPTLTPTPSLSPTITPTRTPTRTKTPCASYCSSDCGSDCGSNCGSDCSSDCWSDCIYNCPLDCIYDCGYDCSDCYDCSWDCSWY